MADKLLTRRRMLRLLAAIGGSALALRRLPRSDARASSLLPDAIAAVMSKPRYLSSTWNLLVTDVQTGETVYELLPDQMALTGSVRKLFSVGLALRRLGANHRFTTPVYRRGEVDAQGTLHGDLILVAAGDLTLGGRLNADGSIAYTDFDHNDANNLGTAILTPQDPLFGLNSLAQQVVESGIEAVTGDVIVDDRLFDKVRVPNQNLLITPIMVNENIVDVTVTPAQPGQPASIDWRPKSAAFGVNSLVQTVEAGRPETVSLSREGLVDCIGTVGCAGSLSGDIPVGYQAPLSGSAALVQTFRIEEPAAFARTTFIEALARAGVTVGSPSVAGNAVESLGQATSYPPSTCVARFVSPPYAEYARLILKVSLNLGANLSLMLFGLAHGRRTMAGALEVERRTLVDHFGIPTDAFDFPTNGSGSPDSRATPRALALLLTEMANGDAAQLYRDSLPVLGVNGSLAHTGSDLPAQGHVFAKTGTTIQEGALKAQNIAGYIEARSGRQLAFALFVNDAGPLKSISDVSDVLEDEAAIANVIYQSN
jgi:PBP4 family serine-type D-alanyl-D-alanine carboxypeptidase